MRLTNCGAPVDESNINAFERRIGVTLPDSYRRFLLEVKPGDANALVAIMGDLPFGKIGTTTTEQRLRIAGASGEWIVWAKLSELKESWQKPLLW